MIEWLPTKTCRPEGRRYKGSDGLCGGIGAGEESAVKDEVLAGHERSVIGGHPHDGFGDFHRGSETADGMEADDMRLLNIRRAKKTLTHRRFDHRRDRRR